MELLISVAAVAGASYLLRQRSQARAVGPDIGSPKSPKPTKVFADISSGIDKDGRVHHLQVKRGDGEFNAP
jgi:hypothetical protein